MFQINSTSKTASHIRFLRLVAFLYGLLAYMAFLFTILYAVGFVSGLLVPKTIDTGPGTSVAEALAVNTILMALFAIQHSGIARKRFKNWWARYVPNCVERSTYVLTASICLVLLFWQWRPIPAIAWQVTDPDVSVMIGTLAFTGWALVFTSTFLIDHFELFGLRQVTANLTGRGLPKPQFRTPLYYKFVRHPLYLGFIIAFWATPLMTMGHLLFAAVTTTYIFVGIFFEERDLLQLFGDQYGQYKRQACMLIPWPESRITESGSKMRSRCRKGARPGSWPRRDL
ncbi:methanethiol S-methyltransferase [Bradyrhizobium sp. Pa8]|uniref:methanethiol S-methyltransferase n=1 Tax=Bradyrhizobium sp. Pa8 TaxID=3386552 RepID=UPI00403F3D42